MLKKLGFGPGVMDDESRDDERDGLSSGCRGVDHRGPGPHNLLRGPIHYRAPQ